MVWTPSTHNYFSPRHQLPLGCLLSLCAWSPVEMRFGVIWAENSRYVFWGLALWRTAQASTVFISLVPQIPVTWESHNWNKNRGRLFKTEYLEQNISIFCGNKLQKKHLKAWCCFCCCSVASVMLDSMRPHRRQPTRLPCPWDTILSPS